MAIVELCFDVEFKRAMTMLESQHPFVYKEFMSTIQPNSVHLRSASSGQRQGHRGSGGPAAGSGVLGDSVISWGPSTVETDEADPFDSTHTQSIHLQVHTQFSIRFYSFIFNTISNYFSGAAFGTCKVMVTSGKTFYLI